MLLRLRSSSAILVLSFALAGCMPDKEENEADNAQSLPVAGARTEFIGLPNGATISVEPGSVGQQMATYLASEAPAPRSFQIGGDQFEDWSATARPAIRAMVPGLVELLKSYPDVRLQIIGHTDNVGGEAVNLKLSQDRAATAKQHLVDEGIQESRIETIGFGMTKPLADNATPEGRARNRRIELVVVQK